MKYVIIVVLISLAYYYFPTEAADIVQQGKEVIHTVAVKVAEATKEPGVIDQLLGK